MFLVVYRDNNDNDKLLHAVPYSMNNYLLTRFRCGWKYGMSFVSNVMANMTVKEF